MRDGNALPQLMSSTYLGYYETSTGVENIQQEFSISLEVEICGISVLKFEHTCCIRYLSVKNIYFLNAKSQKAFYMPWRLQ